MRGSNFLPFFHALFPFSYFLLPLSLKTRSVTEWRGKNHSIIYANDIEFFSYQQFFTFIVLSGRFAVCACLHRQLQLFCGEITNVVTKVDKILLRNISTSFFLMSSQKLQFTSGVVCALSACLASFCWDS